MADDLSRLLVMIPWIMERDGPTVEEVCEHFQLSEKKLTKYLNMLFVCGLYPFTPDALIEAEIADGRVWIQSAEQFAAPPRPNTQEAVALVLAAEAALRLQSGDSAKAENAVEGARLRQAADKLYAALGLGEVSVELGLDPEVIQVHGLLEAAIAAHQVVRFSYYSYGRNAISVRTMVPLVLFDEGGNAYVQAIPPHSTERSEVRTLRLDRMSDVVITEETWVGDADEGADASDVRADAGEREDSGDERADAFAIDSLKALNHRDLLADLPRMTLIGTPVTLRVRPEGQWILEQYPMDSVVVEGEDRVVTLQVTEPAWLDRLLLRLGDSVTVVSGTTSVVRTAESILARHGVEPDGSGAILASGASGGGEAGRVSPSGTSTEPAERSAGEGVG